MKVSLLTILCLFGSYIAEAISFNEAIQQKKIQLISVSVAVLQDKDCKITVKNLGAKAIRLLIPIGTMFQPEDSTLQPRFLAETGELLLASYAVETIAVGSVCAAATHRSPMETNVYAYLGENKEKMAALSLFLQKQASLFPKSDIQSAVWAITNNHRIEAIADTTFKRQMAMITGQQLQPYKFSYKHQNLPGEVAYRDKELRVEGLFRYGTDKDITAHLGIYDKEGKLLKMLRPNMLHRRGQHSFRFDFTIINVKPGDYFIRLTNGNIVLNEMKVAF
jgi:hypothetical protein